MKTVEYILPKNWGPAMTNDDMSGLEDDESAALDAFIAAESNGRAMFHCLDVADDSQFLRWHDAAQQFPLATDCATFTFQVA